METRDAGPTVSSSTAAGPAPLASFDPKGRPTLVSYDLPDPTSFTGRHVLDLDIPFTDFTDVVVVGTSTVASLPAASDATVDPHTALVAPASVVINPSSGASDPVVLSAPYPLSTRLTNLSWPTIAAMAQTGRRAVIYRSGGGDLDYRVGSAASLPAPQADAAGRAAALRAALIGPAASGEAEPPDAADRAAFPADPPVRGPGGGNPAPSLTIFIDNPARDPQPRLHGPASGIILPIGGTAGCISVDPPAIAVQLDGVKISDGHLLANGTRWAATVTIAVGGIHTLQVTATATDDFGRPYTATDNELLIVTLDPAVKGPPAVVPSVTVDLGDNTEIIAPSGRAVPHITGTADTGGGSEVTVTVTDSANPAQVFTGVVTPDPSSGPTKRRWAADVELLTVGSRTLTVAGVNADGLPAVPATVRLTLSQRQQVLPIDRRMYLVETIALSSFRGNLGAGTLLKTFSLLPGERAQWSVQSYTKNDATARSASSILDSSTSETSSDFESTLSDEQNLKASSARETNLSVNVDAGANWGWGHANVKAGYSDKANSSRDDMSKTLSATVRKHAGKAASNRNLQINTESSTTTATGISDDLARTLTNVNVSRVLNFVFRQMTQEHVVLTHLTDFVLGYYTLDVLLDGNGQPLPGPAGISEQYVEYPLTDINTLLETALREPSTRAEVKAKLLALLSEIADREGKLVSIVEEVIPTDSAGQPAPDKSYLRVARNATQTFVSDGGAAFTVPGIILNAASLVMPTEAVFVDALLGEGDALDTYSAALQEVTIAERKMGLNERQAKLTLQNAALKIVTSGDESAAGLWAQVIGPLEPADPDEQAPVTSPGTNPAIA